MGPASNKVIEILNKLSEINSRKMRNSKTFCRSWRNFLYLIEFSKNKNKEPKQKKKEN